MNKIFLCMVLCATFTFAVTPILQVERPADMPAIPVPMEIPLGETDQTLPFVLISSKQPEIILQQAPAVFSSPSGKNIGNALCTILPVDVSNRETKFIPHSAEAAFEFKQQDGRLMVFCDGKLRFSYNYGKQLAAGVPEDRRRSTYIHPILDLNGNAMTDDFPQDHLHHRGMSWMWPTVTVAGQQYDLWHIKGVTQEFEKWLAKASGPVCAYIGVKNIWRQNGRKIMDEWVWMRAFTETDKGWALDMCLTWQAVEKFIIEGEKDKGYGGLCFRLAPRENTVITTPDGVLAQDSDLTPLAWADQSGIFNGSAEKTGVAIFQHAGNPAFPAGWCLRHYGFLGVSWPGLTPFKFTPNEPVTLRFRIWIHDGDCQNGRTAAAYQVFHKPPSVKLKLK
ncbi:PmoA family protein [candidate division KSB1 bacterium]|nr:PmoA family protein [candidate division KSB1 bacterium]